MKLLQFPDQHKKLMLNQSLYDTANNAVSTVAQCVWDKTEIMFRTEFYPKLIYKDHDQMIDVNT